MIKENRQIMLSVIALTVGISYKSAFAIIHDDLGYHKACARWV
jgi:hypothetical protein